VLNENRITLIMQHVILRKQYKTLQCQKTEDKLLDSNHWDEMRPVNVIRSVRLYRVRKKIPLIVKLNFC